jgi:hypothetical protein
MPQTVAELIAGWAPFIIVLAIIVFFMRSGGVRARAPSGRTMVELYELYLEEMKRQATALERIAQALERRGTQNSDRYEDSGRADGPAGAQVRGL